MGARIIVGSSNKKILKQLSHFLNENGYNVVGETTDGYDILRRVHTVYPDICILDFNMKGLNGHDVSEVLVADNVCPIITIISSSDLHYFTNLKSEPIFSSLVKPINKDLLINTIDILVKTSKSITKLTKEVSTLKKKQEDKQLINEAKELLMKYTGSTEEESHRKIQKLSMNRGISKRVVAYEIINKYT
ncbi:Fis family transcriptional regulator [Vallitalea longa]|uniref:Stage 0 sporulation protein A homolog n=1 Tax=Vallitalea longa TaxID=2936439 RepID=A0A9W6DEU4_9FIRM|nr:response regulator [Vallitalea longa]GKX27949.1 Fis family transcriptional regulator [Vallitalea longa]